MPGQIWRLSNWSCAQHPPRGSIVLPCYLRHDSCQWALWDLNSKLLKYMYQEVFFSSHSIPQWQWLQSSSHRATALGNSVTPLNEQGQPTCYSSLPLGNSTGEHRQVLRGMCDLRPNRVSFRPQLPRRQSEAGQRVTASIH